MRGSTPCTRLVQCDSDASANIITGNAGNNVITITGGIDAVDGMSGDDLLVVDYSGATTPVINPIAAPIHLGPVDGYAGAFSDVLLDSIAYEPVSDEFEPVSAPSRWNRQLAS